MNPDSDPFWKLSQERVGDLIVNSVANNFEIQLFGHLKPSSVFMLWSSSIFSLLSSSESRISSSKLSKFAKIDLFFAHALFGRRSGFPVGKVFDPSLTSKFSGPRVSLAWFWFSFIGRTPLDLRAHSPSSSVKLLPFEPSWVAKVSDVSFLSIAGLKTECATGIIVLVGPLGDWGDCNSLSNLSEILPWSISLQ